MTTDSISVWRKSSRSSGGEGQCVEVAAIPVWRKSSRSSGSEGQCIEVAAIGYRIAIRDSKNPGRAMLVVGPAAWAAFTDRIKHGDH
jgi:hypothetical protein